MGDATRVKMDHGTLTMRGATTESELSFPVAPPKPESGKTAYTLFVVKRSDNLLKLSELKPSGKRSSCMMLASVAVAWKIPASHRSCLKPAVRLVMQKAVMVAAVP